GTERQQVLAGSSLYGDWSPDGDSLVFEAGAQIYKAAFKEGVVDTSSVVQLSRPNRRCFFPDWGSNGERIAYDNTNCGTAANPTPDSCGIYMITSERRQGTKVAGGRYPNWSPSGHYLIYTGLRKEIFRINTGEEQQTRLTSLNQENESAADIRYPRFSPSREEIVVQINSQVWTMNADGSNQRALTTIENRWWSAGQPDWSPDGERIVYIGSEHTIWVMDADGSNKEQLTTRPEGPVG
ncbi:MAG: hypothetical protein R6U20_11265, partial [Longimonas sp.]|uniref:TolB family protein n=1 Tax=Longimonas sp. TaxID=2039626 RepID=UPI003976287A